MQVTHTDTQQAARRVGAVSYPGTPHSPLLDTARAVHPVSHSVEQFIGRRTLKSRSFQACQGAQMRMRQHRQGNFRARQIQVVNLTQGRHADCSIKTSVAGCTKGMKHAHRTGAFVWQHVCAEYCVAVWCLIWVPGCCSTLPLRLQHVNVLFTFFLLVLTVQYSTVRSKMSASL